MATIEQQPVPKPFIPVFEQAGLHIKTYKSAKSFERDLERFIKRNTVLHLSMSKDNVARSTPLEYRYIESKFYILSAGGAKFDYLKHNRHVAFSVSEPYNSDEDYWSYKGFQAWGKARIISRKNHRKEFDETIGKMRIGKILKQLGQKELPDGQNYRIIELTPERIKYVNPREGIFRVKWKATPE